MDALPGQFKFDRILHEDVKLKSIVLLGTIKGEHCIIVAEKTAFDVNALEILWQPEAINIDLANDIYASDPDAKHRAFVCLKTDIEKLPTAKYSIIYPATDVHIAKYSQQKKRLIHETPELYNDVVAPYIETMIGKRLEWVYNILTHEAESDRILFENPDPIQGFVLLPDLKWDGTTLAALYMCCIVHRRDLRSLRDLRGGHMDFLKNLQQQCQQAVQDKFGLAADQLRLYIHYQPSYYHLHVHVQSCDAEAGEGFAAGRAWLLDDVIDGLQSHGEFFKDRTMHYTLGEGSDLYKLLKQN